MDVEQPGDLIPYLRSSPYLGNDEIVSVEIMSGGVSNRTVLVRRSSGQNWVIKQALSKLRVVVDWFSSPERVHREAQGMKWLSRIVSPGRVPMLLFEDHSEHLLCMEAVPEPHENWKTMLLAGRVIEQHVKQFGELLGRIHRSSYERTDEMAVHFSDRTFFESLRLEPYYAYTADQIPAVREFIYDLLRDTRERRDCLVHGDYSPKNVLVHNDRLVLLDHEVIHWGDPSFDVGFGLTHLLSKAHHVAHCRAKLTQAAHLFWRRYLESFATVSVSDGLEERAVRHTLACLLARVAGRSPLDYLTADQKTAQRRAVLELIQQAPASIETIVDQFVIRVGERSAGG